MASKEESLLYRGKALKPAIHFSLMIYSGKKYDRRSPVDF
jgi:hypothetical protein